MREKGRERWRELGWKRNHPRLKKRTQKSERGERRDDDDDGDDDNDDDDAMRRRNEVLSGLP